MSKNKVNYLWFSLLALFWSGSFIGIKITVEQFPPVFCAVIRVACALIFLTIIFVTMRKSLIVPFNIAWRCWVAGIFSQGIPFAFLFYGEKFIAPALASIINSTVPIWALLLNVIIFRDTAQMTFFKVIGLMISLGGVIAIFWPTLIAGAHSTVIGLCAVLVMALSYAFGALLNQRFFVDRGTTHFQASLWQQHCSSLAFLILTSLCLEHWPTWQALMVPKAWLAFIYMGLFSTAFAWIIYYHLIRSWDAVRASSVTYVVPLLAISWDFLLLHLKPTWNELGGAVLILLGVTLIQLKRTSHA